MVSKNIITNTPQGELYRLFGLTEGQVLSVLGEALKNAGSKSISDIFFQFGSAQSILLDQGVIKDKQLHIVKGAGVRVLAGDKCGYSHSDDPTLKNLRVCADYARTMSKYSNGFDNIPLASTGKQHNLYPVQSSAVDVEVPLKVAILKKIDELARAYDSRIINVSAEIQTEHYIVIIATSRGDFFLDRRPLVRLDVTCLAEDGKCREVARSGGGGRQDFSMLAADDFWREITLSAAKQSIDLLSATETPVGAMDLVIASGWPGILIHESVGHGLEGNFNRKGTSAFSGSMGQMVGSPLVTVIDDGTMDGRRGSLNIDDEGTPTHRTVLIENGRLVSYLQDKQNAYLMNAPLTGNGRRESYECAPMVRMTNTYMDAGPHDPAEIIKAVKKGLFAGNFSGGQVDITSGKFTFKANNAYLIEDGQLTRPVKGAMLIGDGPKCLHNVTMVGNDLKFDPGVGTCGKDGQSVPVGVGMPTVLIKGGANGITVGGK